MADRGFIIKDQLCEIGVELNIPLFLEGRQQLPLDEVQKGRQIVSLMIHVESLSMIHLVNQVVCMCTNQLLASAYTTVY